MFSDLNEKLSNSYEEHKNEIFSIPTKCNNGKMHGPFLIHPNDKYWKSELKVTFVGQETRGWTCNDSVLEQMAKYKDFNLGENYYSSPFWNVIRQIEMGVNGSHLSSSWLNLNRYDQNKKRPTKDNLKFLSELDFLLLKELEILKPDVIIFFTGYRYDSRLKSLLNADFVEVNGFTKKELCIINSGNVKARIFRTYHPNYLRRSKLEKNVVKEIKKLIVDKSV